MGASSALAISLAGSWRFALDRADVGVQEKWFARELPDRIELPGVLQAQGYGDPIGTNTPWVLSLYDRHWFLREDYRAYTNKVPFLSQPPRHYLGAAWYQRDIEIPKDWRGRRVVLFLERPHWESRVWLDDKLIGTNNSLCAPHEFELGVVADVVGAASPPRPGSSANRGGDAAPTGNQALVPGKHRLTVRVDNRMILPYRPDAHSVSDSLGSSWNGMAGRIELRSTRIQDVQVFPNISHRTALVKFKADGVETQVEWKVEGALWDEFSPTLHERTICVGDETCTVRFGMREIRRDGQQILLNGRPVYFRMTHDGGDFPLTGYPPTEVEPWRRIIRACRAWGLNGIRFHSWCPPEAAFEAADELGFYLQVEPGMWNTFDPGSPMEKMLYAETERILRAYGNHPSFVLFSPSNEPKGRWRDVLPKWAAHFRAKDPRRLYTSGTGFTDRDAPGPLDQVDFTATARFGQNRVRGEPGWFGKDYRPSLEGVTVPVITHEVGQWCAYPDFDVIRKFTGYLRPGNYEIFRDSAAAAGLLERNKDFAWASGRFQLACYKEEIEANLRTPGLSGFQLLDLHDYLGQGTALVGLLDAFWESKGFATPEEFRRFCGPMVLLARLKQRVFTTADAFHVEVEAANFGPAGISNAVPVWRVGELSGELPATQIPIGKNIALGTVSLDLSKLPAPGAYRLVVGLKGTGIENDWNFWLYPAQIETNSPVLMTGSWDEAEKKLADGGKVLFVPRSADLDWWSPPLGSVPIFWNRQMGPAWGRMLGLWCDTNHPALAEFPTEACGDWQWTELTRRARAINLDRLPRELQPIVQPIDDWNRNYKLGLVFECRVGAGRLMVCSADLDSTNVVARQLRRSLLDYMATDKFQPKVVVTNFSGVLFDTRIMRELGATANNATDGDPNTFWSEAGKYPHELKIDFPQPVTMAGLVIMPRQNHREHEGDIREYAIAVSDDGEQWREVARGEWPSSFHPKTVKFGETVTARHLKLTALSGFGNDGTAAVAELAVMQAGPKLAGSGTIEYKRGRTATQEMDE